MEDETNEEKIQWLKENLTYIVFQRLLDLKWKDYQLALLYDEIAETDGYDGMFLLTKSCKGKRDEHRIDELEVYVDQTVDGGFTGDEFAGDVYVQIAEQEYISWHYYM